MQIAQALRQTTKPFVSLEFFPPAAESHLPEFYETVERLRSIDPLFLSVTYGAGGGKQQNTLNVTAELARRGFTVMAHLTCVGAEPQAISDFVSHLRAAGVHNVLALRGDAPRGVSDWDWNAGHFHNARDLVRFLRSEHPDLGIGVAGYPAPHPDAATFASDRAYLADKLRAGADFVITQLFFDVREYESLVSSLRAAGLETPVIPGILPIQSFDSLRRVLSLCGANIPGKLYLELEAAHNEGGVEAVREAGLRFAARQIQQLPGPCGSLKKREGPGVLPVFSSHPDTPPQGGDRAPDRHRLRRCCGHGPAPGRRLVPCTEAIISRRNCSFFHDFTSG